MVNPAETNQHDPAMQAAQLGVDPMLAEANVAASGNMLTRFFGTAKTAGQLAMLGFEVSPANEFARLALFGAAMAVSPTPLVGAAVAGLSTAATEALSGLAAAGLLQGERSARFIEIINEKGAKLGLPMDHRLSPASKAFWTFMGGAPLGMWLEQREDPSRTVEQNRRYALMTAAWQGGVLAVAGAGGAEAVHKVMENPLTGIGVALGVAAVAGVGVWAKKKGSQIIDRIRQKRNEDIIQNVDQHYEVYAQLVGGYGEESPQHQGLTAADFETVLRDERVITTDITVEGRKAVFPQLSPVEHYEWLNAGFYAEKFPEATSSGNLLHFTDLPSVKPGKRVRERLKSLADEDGVLVFDYPSSDPEYPKRVQALLEDLGIQGSEVEVIGTQTYFAGQTTLKRKPSSDEEVRGFSESYSAMIADDEYDHKRFANGASLRTAISPDQAEVMRRFYDRAYEVLNDHPCNQGLDPDQFYKMMTEQDWVTKIVNSKDGTITALCLLTSDLDELSWVNADYYRRHFPDKAATKQIVWFPGLAADPDSTQRHNLQAMANLIAELAEKGNNDMLIVFDCCDYNTGFLDQALNFMINRTKEASVDIQPIATQTYCAIRTSRKQ